jgi:hypothetical protein
VITYSLKPPLSATLQEMDVELNRPLDPSASAAATAAAELQYQQHLRRQQQLAKGWGWFDGGANAAATAAAAAAPEDAPNTLETGPLFLYAPMSGVWAWVLV